MGHYSLKFLSTDFSDRCVLHSALGRALTPRNLSWKHKIISPSFSSCAEGASMHSVSVLLRENVMLRWADVTEWKSAAELQQARCGVMLVWDLHLSFTRVRIRPQMVRPWDPGCHACFWAQKRCVQWWESLKSGADLLIYVMWKIVVLIPLSNLPGPSARQRLAPLPVNPMPAVCARWGALLRTVLRPLGPSIV